MEVRSKGDGLPTTGWQPVTCSHRQGRGRPLASLGLQPVAGKGGATVLAFTSGSRCCREMVRTSRIHQIYMPYAARDTYLEVPRDVWYHLPLKLILAGHEAAWHATCQLQGNNHSEVQKLFTWEQRVAVHAKNVSTEIDKDGSDDAWPMVPDKQRIKVELHKQGTYRFRHGEPRCCGGAVGSLDTNCLKHSLVGRVLQGFERINDRLKGPGMVRVLVLDRVYQPSNSQPDAGPHLHPREATCELHDLLPTGTCATILLIAGFAVSSCTTAEQEIEAVMATPRRPFHTRCPIEVCGLKLVHMQTCPSLAQNEGLMTSLLSRTDGSP